MTVATKEENQMGIQDKGLSYQGISNPQKYSCQILQEKTTLEACE